MAILTPARPSSERATRPRGSLRDSAALWLNHPLADALLVVVPAMLLLGLGSLMVWSASTVFSYARFGDAYYYMWRQLAFAAVSLAVAWVVTRLKVERLRPLGWLAMGVVGVLLVVTFLPGIGVAKKGNQNWIGVPGFDMLRIQPSEFAKLAIILWGASLMVAKRRLLEEPKHLLIPFLPVTLVIMGLVVMQRDLGTAIILGSIVLAVLWCVGASWRVLGSLFAVVGTGVVALALYEPHRLARIFAFFDPASDPTGVNYQPNQALYGLASGGWWGLGLGQSRQKWGFLSEAHTDYVLAVIGEELGLVGTLSTMVLFLVLGYAGYRVALRASTFYARIVAGGITTWFMLQALVNVMVVLKMLPVLGVPLPLVSYGGSSLLASLTGVGILVSCALEEPDAKAWAARHRRKKQPRRRLSAVLPGRRR